MSECEIREVGFGLNVLCLYRMHSDISELDESVVEYILIAESEVLISDCDG